MVMIYTWRFEGEGRCLLVGLLSVIHSGTMREL
jgi:hypothetical protein